MERILNGHQTYDSNYNRNRGQQPDSEYLERKLGLERKRGGKRGKERRTTEGLFDKMSLNPETGHGCAVILVQKLIHPRGLFFFGLCQVSEPCCLCKSKIKEYKNGEPVYPLKNNGKRKQNSY